jgi:hypothetical protein
MTASVAAAIFLAALLAQGPSAGKAGGKRPPAAAAPTAEATSKKSRPGGSGSEKGGGDKAASDKAAPTAEKQPETGAAAEPGASGTPAKPVKTKVYTFGAMDVEGKLKTPQLLYFLNRVKLELEMSAPDKRSFMKELERSADDKNL